MRRALTAITAIAFASPALADVSVGVGLSISGDAEIRTVQYLCNGREAPLTVQYINAAPNFLALIPIEDKTLIFVTTVSASGAKYESGQFVWWDKGNDATLSDVTEGLDAAPVFTCSEDVQTP